MGAICCGAGSVAAQPVVTFRLIEAAAAGNLKDISKIIGSGCDVNAKDRNGRTALHLACAEGHDEVVRFLLSQGADVNAKDKRGVVPLSEAQENHHLQIAKVLEDAGGKVAQEWLDEIRSTSLSRAHSVESDTWTSAFSVSRNCSFTKVCEDETALSEKITIMNNHRNFAIMEAFPKAIAVAVIHGQDIAPIQRENASLFYSDIVGFTSLSSKLSPEKVSSMLIRLFSRFDQIAHVHGVQKVDMIGDAYIAATNLLEDQPDDHAARLAHFASDVAAAAAETPVDEDDPDGPLGFVCIRVGLHCGAVSARVVTAGALRYTLFGDTVQIAAAMESSGSPGRIQCSDAFALLVLAQADDFLVAPRKDKVSAGGKALQTFWLTSLRRAKSIEGSMSVRAAGDLAMRSPLSRLGSSTRQFSPDAAHRAAIGTPSASPALAGIRRSNSKCFSPCAEAP